MAGVRKRLIALGGLVVISLIAVACGDDDEGADAANSPSDTTESIAVRGVTDSTIKLGFQVDDLEEANDVISGIGGDSETFVETEVQKKYQAVIDYVNAEGGIAGRTIEPVWYYEDPTNIATSSGRQQEAQRACATWTEDDEVFAFGGGGSEELMRECAVRSKTVLVALEHTSYPSQEMFESIAPYWYAPHLMVADRREAALAETLLADGFFTPEAKVGILIEDKPGIRAGVEAALKPALEAAGVDVVAEAVYPDPIESPWDTYVLQFQSAEVTHVVMSYTGYLYAPSLFMMLASESQEFRPRWGMGSDQYPANLINVGAPREQLAGVQGVGWIPSNDVGKSEVASAQEELCVEILTEAGLPSGPGDGGFCELVFFLKAALDGADAISPEVLADAVEELGADYVSPLTLDGATQFGPGRHDGPSSMRSFAFDDRCGEEGVSCFRYTNPARPVPE